MNADPNRTIPAVEPTHIPIGSLVTVTIGRNVPASSDLAMWSNGDEQRPMRPSWWKSFQRDLRTVVRDFSSETFGPFVGDGGWQNVPEDSAVVTGIIDRPVAPFVLEAAITALARHYDQDAISLAWGANKLVGR